MHCMEKLLPQEILTFTKLSRISRNILQLLSLKKAPENLSVFSKLLDPSTCEERQRTVRNSPAVGKQERNRAEDKPSLQAALWLPVLLLNRFRRVRLCATL